MKRKIYIKRTYASSRRKPQNSPICYIWAAICLIVNALLVATTIEYIWRGSLAETFTWIGGIYRSFLVSVYIIIAIELILMLISNNLFATTLITNIIGFVFAMVNYLKVSLRGEVFTFADLKVAKEALSVVKNFEIELNAAVWWSALVLIVFTIAMFFVARRIKVQLDQRIRIGCVAAGIVLCFFLKPFAIYANNKLSYSGIVYEAKVIYNKFGVVSGTIITRPKDVEKPEGYSKKAIAEICSSVQTSPSDIDIKDVVPTTTLAPTPTTTPKATPSSTPIVIEKVVEVNDPNTTGTITKVIRTTVQPSATSSALPKGSITPSAMPSVAPTPTPSAEVAQKQGKPNVIFIMNESLFEVSKMPGIKLDKEPLNNIKALQEKYTAGGLLTPSYAGNTAQVEYEVLSGYPSYNVSGIAYNDYVKDGMDTLVSLYEKNGYDTYALHPNSRTFYNRNRVYNYFGFNHIYFSDNMPLTLNRTGGKWVDDESLYNNVLDILSEREDKNPFFMYMVTTQNHGGYKWEFANKKVNSLDEKLSEENKQALETYANLSDGADDAVAEFLKEVETWDEPTIVVVFGDHAPELQQFGLEPDDMYVETHTTQLLIWNNYGLEKKDIGGIAAYRLGAYVTHMIGITDDAQVNMLADENSPNIVDNRLITKQGDVVLRESWSDDVLKAEQNRWMLQYDRMFGKNFYHEIMQSK